MNNTLSLKKPEARKEYANTVRYEMLSRLAEQNHIQTSLLYFCLYCVALKLVTGHLG